MAEFIKREVVFFLALVSIALGFCSALYGDISSGILSMFFGMLLLWRSASGEWEPLYCSFFAIAFVVHICIAVFGG